MAVHDVEAMGAKPTEPPSLLLILTLRWRFVLLNPFVVYTQPEILTFRIILPAIVLLSLPKYF